MLTLNPYRKSIHYIYTYMGPSRRQMLSTAPTPKNELRRRRIVYLITIIILGRFCPQSPSPRLLARRVYIRHFFWGGGVLIYFKICCNYSPLYYIIIYINRRLNAVYVIPEILTVQKTRMTRNIHKKKNIRN